MINAISIDLEYWWNIEFLKGNIRSSLPDLMIESVEPLLELLDKYDTRATFFVLGMVAEKYEDLIEKIHSKGHEIGSHGYSHKMISDLGKNGFEEDLKRSIKILGKYHPIGYRAPSFSISKNTSWALDILKKNGFKYDSSIFPIKTMLYGVPDAPVHIYRPSVNNITQHDCNGSIIEFPLSVVKLGKNIPIAGGFYLRALPLCFLKWGINRINEENRPALIYLHPWETNPNTPRVNMSLSSKIITYYGIDSSLDKLEDLLKEFTFKPLQEVLYDI